MTKGGGEGGGGAFNLGDMLQKARDMELKMAKMQGEETAMAKGGGGGFSLGGMGDMLRQAQDMQRKMAKVQEEMKERVVEFGAGGGMVTAQANGAQELLSVKISKECVDPNDVGMLEDLVVAAVNGALKKAAELNQKEMSKITGGLNIPGLM